MTRLRSVWDADAQDWSEVQEGLSLPLYKAILSCLPVVGRCRLLDLGCGAGSFCSLAASIGVRPIGLDSSPTMLALARERAPEVEFVQGDMQDLPFPSSTFDAVTAIHSVQSASSARAVFREMKRVARAGAAVVVATLGPEERCEAAAVLRALARMSKEAPGDGPDPFALARQGELETLATEAGLTPVLVEDVECAWTYDDVETAVRGLMAGGAAVSAARAVGDKAVSRAIVDLLGQFQVASGGVLLRNRYRFMMASAPDDTLDVA
ncbi:MAG: class I SAM-dependent methyltransferase [Deltaproteobacteria bacterium]|nr:class I SAM-dependent methyltransferase [Deltaproteobacteria bacterium]